MFQLLIKYIIPSLANSFSFNIFFNGCIHNRFLFNSHSINQSTIAYKLKKLGNSFRIFYLVRTIPLMILTQTNDLPTALDRRSSIRSIPNNANTTKIVTLNPREPGSTSNCSPLIVLTTAAIVHAIPIP